jgi:hypothetical protein
MENQLNEFQKALLKELQKALLWFEQHGFECYEDGGSIYLVVLDFHIQVSTSEISYRAELWDVEQVENN